MMMMFDTIYSFANLSSYWFPYSVATFVAMLATILDIGNYDATQRPKMRLTI